MKEKFRHGEAVVFVLRHGLQVDGFGGPFEGHIDKTVETKQGDLCVCTKGNLSFIVAISDIEPYRMLYEREL